MATQFKGGSLVDMVHETLRASIIAGEILPGSPLRLQAIASRNDVSMSVVREALIRLVEQHLVVAYPNQGFRVVEVSEDDLREITELRILMEGQALRWSIERGDMEWEGGLVAAHHVLERAPLTRSGEPGTTPEWAQAHDAFHDALGVGCQNARLLQSTRNLRAASEMYRQLSGRVGGEKDRDVAGEHRLLLDLATTRRADEAVEALAAHFEKTLITVVDGGLLA